MQHFNCKQTVHVFYTSLKQSECPTTTATTTTTAAPTPTFQKKKKENLSYLRAAKLRIMAVNQTASAFTAFNVFCHAHCPLQKQQQQPRQL